MIERAESLPGVQSATIAMCGIMTGCRSAADGIVITGYTSQPGEQMLVLENRVGRRYFSTVGMTIVRGRDFTDADIGSDAKIAIINEAMARTYFKDRDPIGERFGGDEADIEIIGVVRDARGLSVREAPAPMAWYPLDATPAFVGSMQIRTNADPETTAAALRKALREIEPNLPVDRVTPISELAAGTLRQERVIARLASVLGVLALALASLGLYGLMSYAVKQRTAELGVRFALGAPRPRVLWMVFRESLTLMIAGIADRNAAGGRGLTADRHAAVRRDRHRSRDRRRRHAGAPRGRRDVELFAVEARVAGRSAHGAATGIKGYKGYKGYKSYRGGAEPLL